LDITTLLEQLTPPVAAAIDETLLRVKKWIEEKTISQ
jgi:hypothetical protein